MIDHRALRSFLRTTALSTTFLAITALALLTLGACSAPPAAEPAPAATPPVATPEPAPVAATLDFELEMKNPATPRDGVLTGGQPTLGDLETLAEGGYRTVISLRSPDEAGQEGEVEKVAALGMEYIALPIAGTDGLTPENARELAALLDDPDRQPLLLHCGSSNRVGALLALAAFHADGASADDALALGKAGGLRSLEKAVRERLVPADGE